MRKTKRGAITIIFLMIIALILTLLLAATQSRVLLSIRRSQSASDILIATYTAESEVNDAMARLIGGYWINASQATGTETVDGMKINIVGKDQGQIQTVDVTVARDLAVGKVEGVRRITSIKKVNDVEVVLMLDCTGSMNSSSGVPGQTRLEAEAAAALNFVQKIGSLPDADKFKLGVGVFGIDSSWMKYGGIDMKPDSGLSYSQIVSAIQDGFGNTVSESPVCSLVNSGGTNVGLAYRHAHDYLKGTKQPNVKQVEVVITDGEPNSRSLDTECPPSIACSTTCKEEAKDYLRCTVADSNTFVPKIGQNGVRDPNVDAYAVTIFDSPPPDVVDIFKSYASKDGYYNASQASQLTDILNEVFNSIIKDRSTISVKRVVPLTQ